SAQCVLIGLPRSTYYYEAVEPDATDLMLMRRVDEIYTARPFYGSRRIAAVLQREGHAVNRKRIQYITHELGLAGQLPGPVTSKGCSEHRKYPYLLRGLKIVRPLQVWSTDITYIRLPDGFMY